MPELRRDWLKFIDISLIDVYPIQFANCDRLQKNDAVYIFDEVGSGKTISSGLMALDYLYNNPGKVLIITTNALAKKGANSEYGQFLKDWYDKLPFKQLNLSNRIDIVNNHYANLVSKEKYGLVIIDEAQLFLNQESLRYKYLSEYVKAEKIVFLTATPIKTSKNDLYTYVRLAKCVTNKEISSSWIDEINTNNKKPEEIICSMFDIGSPVTRYFKDTIMSLNVEGYHKRQARRLTPQLWQYGNSETKNNVLLRNINEKYKQDVNNRFVVFTRFVEKEAKAIEELLLNAGFKKYEKAMYSNEIKTFKVITGSNAYELSEYCGTSSLPTVLILTYQIAEQGVNLPGYNHVINYHVSAFPSALEQRFGRIGRMGKNGSQYSEINMCFLISKDYWDTNTWNFYCAIAIYLHNLISYLPSKNTILSEEIIQKYGETKDYVRAYIEKINELIKQASQINHIIEYFTQLKDEEIEDKSTVGCMCDSDLFEFIDENGIEFDTNQEKERAIKSFKTEVKAALAEFNRGFSDKDEFSPEKYEILVKSVSDKVFYSEDAFNINIRTVDAISECGKFISEQESFMKYTSEFKNRVKLPIMVFNYLDTLNQFFEQRFINNDFDSLFPYNGYVDVFEKIFAGVEICSEDKKLMIDNCNVIVTILPVFKMFSIYETILQGMVYTQMRDIRVRFDFNPFKAAFHQIYKKVRQDIRYLGLSDVFFNKYFEMADDWQEGSSVYRDSEKLYTIKVENGVAQASNWYKLAYHYTRKEAACFINRRTLCMNRSDNFYWMKEKLIKFLAINFDLYTKAVEKWNKEWYEYDSAYKVAMDGEDSSFNPQSLLHEMRIFGEPEQPEIINEYEHAENQLKAVLQKRDNERNIHQSLFNHFIFTDGGNYREYSMTICVCREWKVYISDLWTQGIFDEIVRREWTYLNCTLDKIAKLPSQFDNISIY